MFGKSNSFHVLAASLVQAGLCCLLVSLVFVISASGQSSGTTSQVVITKATAAKPAKNAPAFQAYKNIKLGMTADEVKTALGKPETESAEELYYTFGEDESAQIMIDKDKKVRVISLTYSENNKNAPKFEDVFGPDEKKEPKPDGSIYKMVRYPEAGFWVAYSGSVNGDTVVSITLQKM